MKKLVAFVLAAVAAGAVFFYLSRDPTVARTLDETTAKSMIAATAAMPRADFEKLAAAQTGPSLASAENQPLSLVLLSLDRGADEAARAEFDFDGGTPPKPKDIAAAMEATSAPRGMTSLLGAEHISKIELEIAGDDAQGTASFAVPGICKGKVSFVARRQDGRWRMTEFRFPARGVATVRDASGVWKASRAGG